MIPDTFRRFKSHLGFRTIRIFDSGNASLVRIRADVQLGFGMEGFLLRSRRGSVLGGALHLLFCVCWVFQGRITWGWRGLSMATSRRGLVYSLCGALLIPL